MSTGSYPDGVTDADIEREMAAPAQRRCGTCARWVPCTYADGAGVCDAEWVVPGQVEPLDVVDAERRVRGDDCGEECTDWEEWS